MRKDIVTIGRESPRYESVVNELREENEGTLPRVLIVENTYKEIKRLRDWGIVSGTVIPKLDGVVELTTTCDYANKKIEQFKSGSEGKITSAIVSPILQLGRGVTQSDSNKYLGLELGIELEKEGIVAICSRLPRLKDDLVYIKSARRLEEGINENVHWNMVVDYLRLRKRFSHVNK